MAPRAQDRCPLCGAHLDALGLLGACEELLDGDRCILAGRCPHCQGRLDLMIRPEQIDVGYVDRGSRFDVVLSLSCAGLVALREAAGEQLTVAADGRRYRFSFSD